jgi:hypothetical protein
VGDKHCSAAAHGFLRCTRARGHAGSHYDALLRLAWGGDSGREPGDQYRNRPIVDPIGEARS